MPMPIHSRLTHFKMRLDGVPHGLDGLGLLFGNRQLERVFEIYYQLQHVETISTEIREGGLQFDFTLCPSPAFR